MNVHASALVAIAALFATGCAATTDIPTFALYPGPPLPRDQVARVFGSIASVDGHDVSELGRAFELRSGCHVVETLNEAVDSSNYVTSVGRVGAAAFTLSMRPGYSYFFRRDVGGELTAAVGPLRPFVFVEERDAAGERRRTITPRDAESCPPTSTGPRLERELSSRVRGRPSDV